MIARRRRRWFACSPVHFLWALLAACPPPEDAEPTCPIRENDVVGDVDTARVLLVRNPDGSLRVDGRAGAVSAVSTVHIDDASTTSDEDGAFTIETSAPTPVVRVDDSVDEIVIDDDFVDERFACAVSPLRQTGTLPNDVALARCDGELLTVVVNSADGALTATFADGREAAPTVSFPVESDVGAAPFSVAMMNDGRRALVTLFGHHRVALVDVCAGAILDVAAPTATNGSPWRHALDAPLVLPYAVDVDLDGDEEIEAHRFAARHPQGVATRGDVAWVAFTNHLTAADGENAQVLAPGVVSRFFIDDDRLVHDRSEPIATALNPTAIVVNENAVWVSLSGAFGPGLTTGMATDGALVRIDELSLQIIHTVDVGRFAPARPALAPPFLVVGSLLRGEILVVDHTAVDVAGATILTVPTAGVESLFDAEPLGPDLVLVTGFSGDSLHVVDLKRRTVDAAPFDEGLTFRIGDGTIVRGPLALAVDGDAPGRAHAVVLFGLSSETMRLDFSKVFGP